MAASLPFPDSLCHRCAAPPRYVVSDRGAVFVYCALLARYPPQPIVSCERFSPADPGSAPPPGAGTKRTLG